MTEPKKFSSWRYEAICEEVTPNQYSYWTVQDDISAAVANLAGYPGSGDFYGCLVVTSRTSENPPSIGGVEVRANSPVVFVRTVRYCEHDGRPHINADDRLLFQGSTGAYKLEQRDATDHYTRLSTDTSLDFVTAQLKLPSDQSRGTHADLRERQTFFRFSTSG